MDKAHEETEKILKDLEKQIKQEYTQASKEIQAKLDDYMARFCKKDETWQKWVDEGKKTKEQYKEWRVGQLAIGKRWEEQKKAIVGDIAYANQTARNIISKQMPGVYAENHNFGTYEVEKDSLINTSYILYDKDTVENLLNEGNQLYHDPGRDALDAIAKGKEERWNRQQIQSAMLQGIMQGESVFDIAERLARTTASKNENVAIRNARTITTGVENKARTDSYERANKMGINTQKQWIATLDGRTRHSHRALDGEHVDNDKPFSNKCMFPGDPSGAGHEIYNCRCTLIAYIKGYENTLENRKDDKLGGMSYEEWKKAKLTYQDIKHGKRVGKRAKGVYLGEYYGFSPLENTSNGGKMNTEGEMFRKKTERFETMPRKQYNRIKKAFTKQGGIIVSDGWALERLEKGNAEGITYNENTILLPKRPSRSAVYEELIHATQYRIGINDGSMGKCLECEVLAKEKLLKYAKEYELTEREIIRTKELLAKDRRNLAEYRRSKNEKV